MPACGYEFYLLVFNLISSWTLEDKIRIHVRACNILYIHFSMGAELSMRLLGWPACRFTNCDVPVLGQARLAFQPMRIHVRIFKMADQRRISSYLQAFSALHNASQCFLSNMKWWKWFKAMVRTVNLWPVWKIARRYQKYVHEHRKATTYVSVWISRNPFLAEVLFRKGSKDVVNNYTACFCPHYFTCSFLSRTCRMKIADRFMAKTGHKSNTYHEIQ